MHISLLTFLLTLGWFCFSICMMYPSELLRLISTWFPPPLSGSTSTPLSTCGITGGSRLNKCLAARWASVQWVICWWCRSIGCVNGEVAQGAVGELWTEDWERLRKERGGKKYHVYTADSSTSNLYVAWSLLTEYTGNMKMERCVFHNDWLCLHPSVWKLFKLNGKSYICGNFQPDSKLA